jgi:hypothetical protein
LISADLVSVCLTGLIAGEAALGAFLTAASEQPSPSEPSPHRESWTYSRANDSRLPMGCGRDSQRTAANSFTSPPEN